MSTKSLTNAKKNKPLVAAIDAYCAKNGMSRCAFSRKVTGSDDGNLVFEMQVGRVPRIGLLTAIQKMLGDAFVA